MKLEKIVRMTQPQLKTYAENTLKSLKYKVTNMDGFLYAEGTIPIMLVAHMDTVHKTPVQQIFYSKDGKKIMSPQGIGGDDRCGIYMILRLVSELNCHVLFCEDEETGGVGARKFVNSKIKPELNYLIELDRKGTNDAVFYDCDNKDFVKFVESFGFKEQYGSFSDISFVAEPMGAAAVNLSSGYYNPHSTSEVIDTAVLEKVIEQVRKMVLSEAKKFPYVKTKRYYTATNRTTTYGGGYYEDDYYGRSYGEGCVPTSTNAWSGRSKPYVAPKNATPPKTFKDVPKDNVKNPKYYSSLYTSLCPDYSTFIEAKPFPSRGYYPIINGVVPSSIPKKLYIGEDEMCYEYEEEYNILLYFGEAVVNDLMQQVDYEDVRCAVKDSIVCETMTRAQFEELIYGEEVMAVLNSDPDESEESEQEEKTEAKKG